MENKSFQYGTKESRKIIKEGPVKKWTTLRFQKKYLILFEDVLQIQGTKTKFFKSKKNQGDSDDGNNIVEIMPLPQLKIKPGNAKKPNTLEIFWKCFGNGDTTTENSIDHEGQIKE